MTPKKSLILILFILGTCCKTTHADLIHFDLNSTPDGQLFYVTARVGQGDSPQLFNLLVASNYPTTWIASREMNPTRGYKNSSQSDYMESWQLPRTETNPISYWYRIYTDTMQIGTQLVKNQQFAVVYLNESSLDSLDNQIDFDGILGLGDDNMPAGVLYFFKRLRAAARFDQSKFSLYINNSASINNHVQGPTGALVFGGTDDRYYTGDLNYAHLYTDFRAPDGETLGMHKTLVILAIHLDWSRVRPETTTPIDLLPSMRNGSFYLDLPPSRLRLDSSTKLFVGNKKILDKIHLDFIGARLVGEKSFYVFADCYLQNKPDLVFTVDQLEFRITPEEYVINGEVDNSQVCFSAFKPYLNPPRKSWDNPVWVFGTKFLRKYYTVFDYEQDVVGFATPT